MALFTSSELQRLQDAQNVGIGEFVDAEINDLVLKIRSKKPFIYHKFIEGFKSSKIVEVPVDMIRSFYFESVPSIEYALMPGAYETYGDYAYAMYPQSFREVYTTRKSRFEIWKTYGFLTRLATELELPKNMWFAIRSKPIAVGSELFDKNKHIKEFLHEICIVTSN